jgi:hypothetical protein
MVHAAVGCLKANELPPKLLPSWRWFQEFIKNNPNLFWTLQTKAIAQVQVSATDVEVVKDWFHSF